MKNLKKGGRKKLQKDLQHTVRIGSDVWIGAGVTILAGADIGDGSIIASGAVVKGNVEPFTIVAGIPAKKIKNRFEKDIVNKLMRIKWWLRSDEFIQTHRKLFMIPEITLEDLEIFE